MKKKELTFFQDCALKSYKIFLQKNMVLSTEIWESTLLSLGATENTARKCCPKLAFVSLIERNLLKGVSGQIIKNNSRNATYAVTLVSLYKNGKIKTEFPMKLKWEIMRNDLIARKVIENPAMNNQGQLDVVEVFYKKQLLK